MPDGGQAEQELQSVADTAVGSQKISGSFNISGVIAVIVQVFFPPFFFQTGVLCWWHWLIFFLSLLSAR